MSKNLLNYYKNSLADTLRSAIKIDSFTHQFTNVDLLNEGKVEIEKTKNLFDQEEVKINKKRGISSKKDDWQSLERLHVLLSPFSLNLALEHNHLKGGSQTVRPFWIPAILEKTGKLNVAEDYFPLIPRIYLSPVGQEENNYIFSSIETVDEALSYTRDSIRDWKEYKAYISDIFSKITDQHINSFKGIDYITETKWVVLIPDETISAAKSILDLYTHLINEKELPELLKTIINVEQSNAKACPELQTFITGHLDHLGQMGNEYALSISQRKALYSFLQSNHGSVLAVNGPPGTGKTTLLQSVVANSVVLSAIEGEDAPLILACSTNNQAVTNILESFAKKESNLNQLIERWIPNFKGYATYLPSGTYENINSDTNFIKINDAGTFGELEKESTVMEAKRFFLIQFNNYFNSTINNLLDAIGMLKQEIKSIKTGLEKGSKLWVSLSGSLKDANSLLSDSEHTSHDILDLQYWEETKKCLEQDENKIKKYFENESFWTKLLCIISIPSALKKRAIRIKSSLRDSKVNMNSVKVYSENNVLEYFDDAIRKIDSLVKAIRKWNAWKKEANITNDPPKDEESVWRLEYQKLEETNISGKYFYDEIDLSFRHKAFALATHYWEGRWLDEMTEQLSNEKLNKGEPQTKLKWKTRAMLTPCFVSTFYMAPKFFNYSKFLKKSSDGENLWEYPPLLNFIDCLIVDESGQVSPEVGVATFGLAKRAIVVGDIKQIEPVWNTVPRVDLGNLKKNGLIKNESEAYYRILFEKGFLCSNGSIMKLAQNATSFIDPAIKLNERGMMLVEHRRCENEIIAYCNHLAYNGLLRPMKSPKASLLFPPMLLIHVDGNSTKVGMDRFNDEEARAIAEWIKINSKVITEKYRKPIENVIGVITPFREQKKRLIRQLHQIGIDTNKMKIGTVHALQGAERNIILFSPVYGKGDTGTMFFDRDNKPNMLNVAVSRARDNFIVVGNKTIFNKKVNTPSGKLAGYLLYETKEKFPVVKNEF